jgi:hypothetical protein
MEKKGNMNGRTQEKDIGTDYKEGWERVKSY